jgi:hypothetical protein
LKGFVIVVPHWMAVKEEYKKSLVWQKLLLCHIRSKVVRRVMLSLSCAMRWSSAVPTDGRLVMVKFGTQNTEVFRQIRPPTPIGLMFDVRELRIS